MNLQMPDSKSRIDVLRDLLSRGEASTQDELVTVLHKMRFRVTQSTISRDLRKIGAVKAVDNSGRTIYRLPEEHPAISSLLEYATGLRGLLVNIKANSAMIVIRTTPGSASLIARHLDETKPAGILGTIAGDDTIFVAPSSSVSIEQTLKAIVDSLSD